MTKSTASAVAALMSVICKFGECVLTAADQLNAGHCRALTDDTLVNATQLVDQVTSGRRLAGVDVTDDHCSNTPKPVLGVASRRQLTLPRVTLSPRAATQVEQTQVLTDVHVCLFLALQLQMKQQFSATPDTSHKHRRKLSCRGCFR
jgi:hypothetical protein